MKKQYWLGVLVVLVIGCSNKKFETIRKYDDNKQLKEEYILRKEDAIKHGIYKKYRAGKLAEEGTYENGQLEGIYIFYYDNGQKEIEATYQAGEYVGGYISYFKNGKIEQEGTYNTAHQMEGIWKTYYPNGQVRETVTMQAGVEDGIFVEYHENGHKKTEGIYVPSQFGIEDGGVENGELKEYDETGKLVTIKDCKMGHCKTTWKAE